MAKYLNTPGLWEVIKRIVKGEATLSELGQAVKDLIGITATQGKRIEVNKRAIRVLDIELLERDRLLWEKMNEVEEAALGGSLDDYEKKEDAEEAHREIEEKITALDGKVDALDEKYVQIVDHMTEEEVRAMFEND